MSAEKPYAVYERDGRIYIEVRRPSEIIRCSLEELLEELKGYVSSGSWRLEGGILHLDIPINPRVPYLAWSIALKISAAFSPRMSCRAWKDL